LENTENAAENNDLDEAGGANADDADDPRMTPDPTCACCGKASPIPNEVAVDGVTVWLHRACEPAYLDNDPQPKGRQ
jgi:hypothetical protein